MNSRSHATRQVILLVLFLVFASVIILLVPIEAANSQHASSEPSLPSLSPEKLFQQVSSSVFVVEALGSDGKILTLGSGVVVAHEGAVTNRHVVERAATIRVRRGTQTWAATLAHVDPEHDLVQLRVPGLTASPVPIRASTTLKTGERVYAIGAPEGLELTLSEGLISSLRPYEGIQLIQTTAPVSSGSSGGGLFDSQGLLIGITTFQVKEGQNLNFALPGEWIAALPRHPAGSSMTQGGSQALDDPVVWLYVGVAAIDAQDLTKAVQAFREALRLKPDLAEVWYNLGAAYAKQGQYGQAISASREAVRLKPDLAEAWHNLGVSYAELGQYGQAIAASRAAVRLKPDLAEAWDNLGNAYAGQSQYSEAVAAYGEALRLRPDDAQTWYNLGITYHKQRQYAQAIPAYREALRLKPKLAEAWYSLGAAYASQGDRKRVIEVYQQLRVLDRAIADEFFRKVVLP